VRAILDPGLRPLLLRHLAPEAPSLLAFDFDGTLAPIVADPAQAEMRAETQRLLTRLAALRPCAVLSGRGRTDLAGRLAGVPLRLIVGNHGQEEEAPDPASEEMARQVAQWRAEVLGALPPLPGLLLEDKGISLSLHTRPLAPADKERVGRAARALAAARPEVRLVLGKEVINIVPRGARHKGDALRRAVAQTGCAGAIYVGDDETDEDAFAAAAEAGWLGIRVEEGPASRAGCFLPDQGAIDALLRVLLSLSEEAGSVVWMGDRQ
jgi:trehalose 6-phosphate phosphatase